MKLQEKMIFKIAAIFFFVLLNLFALSLPVRAASLTLSASPSSLIGNALNPVQFTVTDDGGNPVSGADVKWPDGTTIACSTDSSGQCTATISGGLVTAITLTSGGTGYTSAPLISFYGGNGSGAAATANISGGLVTSITLTSGGTGYTSAPIVSFSGGGGSSASATASISLPDTTFTASKTGYANGSFSITFYTITPLPPLNIFATPSAVVADMATPVQFTVQNNAKSPISGADITGNNGDFICSTNSSGQCSTPVNINTATVYTASKIGYTGDSTKLTINTSPSLKLSASPLSVPANTPTSVQFTVTDTNGILVSGVAIDSIPSCTTVSGQCLPVINISSATTYTASLAGYSSDQITIAIILPNPPATYVVNPVVHITDGGTGCTSAPAVQFLGGGGSGATANAIVDFDNKHLTYGQVTGVNVTNGGRGYTLAPTIKFSSGGCKTLPIATATIVKCVPNCNSQCNYGQSDGCNGACPSNIGADCSPGFCYIGGTCDATGNCASGTGRNCDDANLCTDDSCSNTLSQCTHTNNTKPCSDGKKCTDLVGSALGFQRSVAQGNVDQCSGGICVGYNATCVNSCQSTTNREYNGSCDSATGSCGNYTTDDCLTFGNVGYCRDNVCTPDSCQHPFTKATCNISPSPSSLNVGEGSILNWTTACGMPDTGSITDSNGNNLGNNFPLAGSLSVFPTIGTGYTMAVGNYHDTAEVHPLPEGTYQPGNPGSCATNIWFIAPACTITADKKQVIAGNSTTLSWTTANALSGTISGGGLAGADAAPILSGTMETPSVNASTTFTMTPFGPGGAGSCSVTITLLSPPTGGLVPCGRLADNTATTEINESQPCDLCAAMYMLKKIINFVMKLVASIAVFAIVIAGLLHAFSAGDPGKIELAKSAITYALAGLALIFAAWLVIAIILQGLGYADINTWNQVNCNLQK